METRSGRIGSVKSATEQNSSPVSSPVLDASNDIVVTNEDVPSELNTSPISIKAACAINEPGEDFQKQVLQALSKIIDGQKELKSDFETFKREITHTVEFQSAEIEELKKTVKTLQDENKALKTNVKIHTDNLEAQRNLIQGVSDHANRVERATRRNNIRIIGFPEADGENIISEVTHIFSKFGFDHDVEIERAHRDGRRDTRNNRPKHILIKLQRYTDKVNILKLSRETLRSESHRIVDDLTKFDLEEKQRWKEEVNELYENGTKLRFFSGMWRDRSGKLAPFYHKGGCTSPQSAVQIPTFVFGK